MSLWPQIACVAQRVPAGKIGADGGAAWLAGVAAGALAAWAWKSASRHGGCAGPQPRRACPPERA
ncbi:hypothetical protein ACQCRS_23560, partial [Ralstonia pseudosolanacearum]